GHAAQAEVALDQLACRGGEGSETTARHLGQTCTHEVVLGATQTTATSRYGQAGPDLCGANAGGSACRLLARISAAFAAQDDASRGRSLERRDERRPAFAAHNGHWTAGA